ncbi:hypothetical protein B296_00027760 [Ensete ventricosum]|uniref:Uncharacterized protein n=1 Tax=Ensete ventricosum TaxID=4639 RepID=A0A426ZC45_ENSVE|nr:hypothetical protein B296_00027760 [Ensete ventricosum]
MPRTGAQDSDNDEPISMKSMDYPRVALRPGVTRERWTKIAVEQFEAMLHIRKESCEGLNHTKPHPRCCLPPVPPCHCRRLALGSAQLAVARPSPLPPLPLLPSVDRLCCSCALLYGSRAILNLARQPLLTQLHQRSVAAAHSRIAASPLPQPSAVAAATRGCGRCRQQLQCHQLPQTSIVVALFLPPLLATALIAPFALLTLPAYGSNAVVYAPSSDAQPSLPSLFLFLPCRRLLAAAAAVSPASLALSRAFLPLHLHHCRCKLSDPALPNLFLATAAIAGHNRCPSPISSSASSVAIAASPHCCHMSPVAAASSLAAAALAAATVSNRALAAAPPCCHRCNSLLPLLPPPSPTSFSIYW